MIPEAILSQIQDRLDIVEIISAHIPMKRAGRNFKACCPFHGEKTPSFMVSPDKQIFHCFGCGVGGNVFSFLMKIEKKDFREVVEMLADRVGVEIPKDKQNTQAVERLSLFVNANIAAQNFFHETLLKKPEGEKGRSYFQKRGIREKTITEFKLGYAPESWDGLMRAVKGSVPEKVLESLGLIMAKKDGGFYDRFRGRVMFPILDGKGNPVAFGGRVLDDSLPKYMNSPESEIYIKGRHLYGLHQARKSIREKDFVIIVEGYMDLIACFQAGVENVLASLGTALTPDQVRLVKRHTKNVIMLYDADKAGEMATMRGLELFLEEAVEVKVVRLPKGHDPDSFIKEFGKQAFEKEIAQAQTLFDYKLGHLKELYDARSLEGKVKIANEMVLLFAKVQNEIQRAAWVRELAKQLNVSEDALTAELKKGNGKAKPSKSEAPAPAKKESPSVEKLLLGLWLEHPDYLEKSRDGVEPADFRHEKIKLIANRLLASGYQTVRDIMNEFKEDAEAIEILSAATAEMEKEGSKERMLSDCLFQIRETRLHERGQSIRTKELPEAEKSGDKNLRNELLSELTQIRRQEEEIKKKKAHFKH